VAETVIARHPFRGLLWGLLFGTGLAFVLVFSTLMEFGRTQIAIAILIGAVFGVLWGLFGPARSAKSPPPEPVQVSDITESSTQPTAPGE